jgi:hypothetical protein
VEELSAAGRFLHGNPTGFQQEALHAQILEQGIRFFRNSPGVLDFRSHAHFGFN